MILSSLSLAVMTSLSLQATETDKQSDNKAQTEQTSSSEQVAQDGDAPEAKSTLYDRRSTASVSVVPASKINTEALIALIGLVLSSLSLILGVLCLVMIMKQKRAAKVLEDRMETKIAAFNEGAMDVDKVKIIARTIAEKLNDDLQMQINTRITAMELSAQRQPAPVQKEVEKVFEPIVMYASFSPSYLGFRGDELSSEQTSQVTFRIRTINEARAAYQLLENVSSSLIDSSQLDACEYTGNPQSYTYIRLVEEGILEYVNGSDYWRIEKKAIISFE